jgi:hypothetical protein
MGVGLLDRRTQQRRSGVRRGATDPLWEEGERPAGAPFAPFGLASSRQAPLTLNDLITGTWEGLVVCRSARCPACGGTMAVGSRGEDGDCTDCGARLS